MGKRSKRAFTLVEMLVVVGIIAALMVTVIPMVSKYINDGKNDYNEKLKSQLLLSGKDYYSNNKDKLPVKVGLKYKKDKDYDVVSLPEMQSQNYVSNDFVDAYGNSCKESFVYVRQKNDAKEYNYYACLRCTDKNGKIINYSNDLVCKGNNWGDEVAPVCSNDASYNIGVRKKNDHVFNPSFVFLRDVRDSYATSGDNKGKIVGAFVEGKVKSFQVFFPSSYSFNNIMSVNFIDKINKRYSEKDRNDEYTITLTDGVHTSDSCAKFVIDKEKPSCVFDLKQSKGNKTLTLSSKDNYSDSSNISKLISLKANETSVEGKGIGVSTVSKSVLGLKDSMYYGYTMDEAGNSNTCSKKVKIKMFDGEKPYCTITNDVDNKWYSSKGTYRSKTLKAECYVAGGANKAKIDLKKIGVSNAVGSVSAKKTDNDNPDNKVTFDIVFTPANNKAGNTVVSLNEGFVTDDAGTTNDSVKSSNIKVDSISPSISYAPQTSKESGGWYKAPFKLKLSCLDSNSGVSSFKVNNSNFSSGSIITRNSAANPVTYASVCVDKAGNSVSDSNSYKVKVYSENSICGIKSYVKCRHKDCGCETAKYCTNGCKVYKKCSAYTDWSCKKKTKTTGCVAYGIGKKCPSCSPYTKTTSKRTCGKCTNKICKKVAGAIVTIKYTRSYTDCTRSSYTYNCGCKTYYYKQCGCKQYVYCATKGCGIKSYKTCWHY